MKDADALSVKLGALSLRSPLIAASGTFGYGTDLVAISEHFRDDLRYLGASVTKSLSLSPIAGNPMPRIIETPCGMLNAIGLQNIGIDAFRDEKLPQALKLGVPIILSIFARERRDFPKIADKAEELRRHLAAIELNISCPNVQKGGLEFSSDPEEAYGVVAAVRERVSLPLFVKLSPNVTRIEEIAISVERAQADGFTLINSVLAMAVDIGRRKPSLANTYGGLSGPAIKPIALRMVHQVRRVSALPIIGVGGIMTASDVIEFMMVGAGGVQIGTANFCFGTRHFREIYKDLLRYLRREKVAKLSDITGII